MFSGTLSTLLEVIMYGFSVFCSNGSFIKMTILQYYNDRCLAFTRNSNDALWLHRLARFIHKDVGKMADRDSSRNQPNGRKMSHIDFSSFFFFIKGKVWNVIYIQSAYLPAVIKVVTTTAYFIRLSLSGNTKQSCLSSQLQHFWNVRQQVQQLCFSKHAKFDFF